jgi:hypothetical protein
MTAILAVGADVAEATEKLQHAADTITNCTDQWLIKLNEDKSKHVNFINKRCQYLPTDMNGKIIPPSQTVKYLGMTLDAKLRWKVHVKKEREELGLKYRQMYWLLGRRSALTTHNKLILYKQILKPVWTYDIQVWVCTKPSNIAIIQRFQTKYSGTLLTRPGTLGTLTSIETSNCKMVRAEIQRFARKQREASSSCQRRSDPAARQERATKTAQTN